MVDPGLPPEVAGLFRANPSMLRRIRAGWRPLENPPGKSPVALAVAGMFAAVGFLALLSLEGGAAPSVLLFFMLLYFVSAAIRAARDSEESESPEQELYEFAHRYRDSYLLPDDFDADASRLLGRTRQAVDSVLRSRVNTEGLLDDVRNAVMLPPREWEVARLLAKLSSLRGEHRDLVRDGISVEVEAAMKPLERVLAGSESAVTAKVEALERYAAHVADAERAYRARGQIEALVERLPRYEELLAESGADTLGMPEIGRLTGEAGELERALRASIRSAHELFRHLEGPAPSG
ncbi:hypothetical protein [Streptosporangium sp. NPDC048865]|uniref:hypothetical protein n=1 Tax=Streptosporangium sp. NPDC048865 TaxID=3155766 RepID=UPI003435BCE7